MGSGKGNPKVGRRGLPGRILFEMGGVTPQVAKEAMKLAPRSSRSKTARHLRVGGRGRYTVRSTSSGSWKRISWEIGCARRGASCTSSVSSTRSAN